MSYRIGAAAAFVIIVSLVGGAVPCAHAALQGDRFTSRQHRLSFARPDAGWELREHPAQRHTVAEFSNGEGRVAALLLHYVFGPDDVVTGTENLAGRWQALATQIAGIANGGDPVSPLEFAEYKVEPQQIVFDIVYHSKSPLDGGRLRNWVSGVILRDSDNRQHVCAIRCAAAEAAFSRWEGQFDRIMSTLRFEGEKQAPVFIGVPVPLWWYAAGGALLLIVAFAFRRGIRSRGDGSLSSHPAAVSDFPPRPVLETLDNIPDQVLLGSKPEDIPDQVLMQGTAAQDGTSLSGSAPVSSMSPAGGAPAVLPANGFWKCRCGRMNPDSYAFCARCNADRPKKK